jgi:hypothetical protein
MPAVALQLLIFFTRFREMRNVLIGCLGLALGLLPLQFAMAQAQAPPKNEKQSQPPPAKDSQDDADDQPEPKNAAKDIGKDKAKAGEGADAADDADGASKALPYDVYRDPNAEKLLDISAFTHIGKGKVLMPGDLQTLDAMAGGAAQLDIPLVNRVVDAMVSKLTDHANIQALIDPSPKTNPTADVNKGINDATSELLKPIFLARTSKQAAFLSQYTRVLSAKLTPVLKNHLIPRVQAMIILGQAGTADLLPIYVAQIKDPNQTVWVKLWALEGIVNMIDEGARPPGDSLPATAKIIADFLTNSEDVPPPVQLRALEALSALRQGFEPSRPERAAMASAAMRFLADGEAKLEVRSEAARALGLMQIPPTVRKYNFPLVAHSIGLLAADLGTQINTLIPERAGKSATAKKAVPAPDAVKQPTKAAAKAAPANAKAAPAAPPAAVRPPTTNPIKARFLTALLIGPVYQAFDGSPGPRGDSGGLVRISTGDGSAYSQKVFDLVKPLAKASIDLITSGSRDTNDRKKALQARVDALRDFLKETAPPDRHLVQGGEDFPVAQAK